MKYGTGERNPERYMGFLLVCVCATMGEKGSRCSKSQENLIQNQKNRVNGYGSGDSLVDKI